jgi:hypothetical protein
MGIVFWIMLIFIVFLIVKLVLYIFKEKVDVLPKDEKLSKCISILKKVYESLYNYLSVHHIIPMSSVTIYLWYEYVETGCFELTCLVSDTKISSTKLVKREVLVPIIIHGGEAVPFSRILVFYRQYRWSSVKDDVDK